MLLIKHLNKRTKIFTLINCSLKKTTFNCCILFLFFWTCEIPTTYVEICSVIIQSVSGKKHVKKKIYIDLVFKNFQIQLLYSFFYFLNLWNINYVCRDLLSDNSITYRFGIWKFQKNSWHFCFDAVHRKRQTDLTRKKKK